MAPEVLRNSAVIGDQVSFHVLEVPEFLDTGSSISDGTLQGAVEAATNTHLIVES